MIFKEILSHVGAVYSAGIMLSTTLLWFIPFHQNLPRSNYGRYVYYLLHLSSTLCWSKKKVVLLGGPIIVTCGVPLVYSKEVSKLL